MAYDRALGYNASIREAKNLFPLGEKTRTA